MPALFRAWTRLRKRPKKRWSSLVRANFNPPSVALPGPVLSHGSGLATRSGGELSVIGRLQKFGLSVVHHNVKLSTCAHRKLTKTLKSKDWSEPLLPQSCSVFHVCEPFKIR